MWRSTLWMNLIDDESSTIYKLKKRRKKKKKRMKNVKKYLKLRMQKARSVLNVLHEVLCSSQSKQSSLRSSLIISRKSHHFSMRRETSMARALGGASSRVAPPPDLGTNGIFVTFRIIFRKNWEKTKTFRRLKLSKSSSIFRLKDYENSNELKDLKHQSKIDYIAI